MAFFFLKNKNLVKLKPSLKVKRSEEAISIRHSLNNHHSKIINKSTLFSVLFLFVDFVLRKKTKKKKFTIRNIPSQKKTTIHLISLDLIHLISFSSFFFFFFYLPFSRLSIPYFCLFVCLFISLIDLLSLSLSCFACLNSHSLIIIFFGVTIFLSVCTGIKYLFRLESK